jgi:NAD(P)-dependent dehydrogenase (short-subunit alcohol dehydrogenase family)
VNTASMAALTAMPFAAAYHMSKHAVLALSEVLYHELRSQGASVGVVRALSRSRRDATSTTPSATGQRTCACLPASRGPTSSWSTAPSARPSRGAYHPM